MSHPSANSPGNSRTALGRWWLVPLCLGAFAFGAWSLASRWWPPCPVRSWTGIPCLLCGGTRALVACAELDFAGALAWNPLVVIGLAGLLVWFIAGRPMGWVRARGVRVTLAGAVLANWAYLFWRW